MSRQMIYLASRSPRRRELLKQVGVTFEIVLLREDQRRGADVDESPLPDERPDAYALRVACAKAELAARYMGRRSLPPRPVLAADTTVVCDGHIIGKPVDKEDAYKILKVLSGRQHEVVTAVPCPPRKYGSGRSRTTRSDATSPPANPSTRRAPMPSRAVPLSSQRA
jgi:septum formation protein